MDTYFTHICLFWLPECHYIVARLIRCIKEQDVFNIKLILIHFIEAIGAINIPSTCQHSY